MSKLPNILQFEPDKLPEDLQDAQAVAGLLHQVAGESLAICNNINPDDAPGGANSVLVSNTRGLIDTLNEVKTRRYKIPSVQSQSNPVSIPQPQPVSVPAPQPAVESVLQTPPPSTTHNDDNQLELDLNPSTTEQILNYLDSIDVSLHKMCKLLEKIEKQK